MKHLNITRFYPLCRPVVDWGGECYALCSPWRIEAQLEPVFWGEGDMLMVNGSYIDPLRGYRYHARLTTDAVDMNDYGVLNELRRTSAPFDFYPFGLDRAHWAVYIPSVLYRVAKTTPYITPAEFELLGTSILTIEQSKDIAIILAPAVSVSGSGPWDITATWLPMITAGDIVVEVRDEGDNTDQASAHIATGKVVFTTTHLTTAPVAATFSHNITPFEKEVLIL